MPLRVKKSKNISNDVYYQMLSNKASSSANSLKNDKIDPHLSSLLDLLWMKITERFSSMSQAFKFFDVNQSQTISVREFYSGLERLRMSISEEDARLVFSYMDNDGNGDVTYSEFCELCEERRRSIGPFMQSPPKV